MRCRRLETLPAGSYMHADVSWDGRRVLFSFCRTDPEATDWTANESQYYHLFEVADDGSAPRQLTDGPFDDFAPRYLPDGKILFISTRRGGFHRCGRGPCPVYTMATAEADGSNVRVISFHETHEWDPAVLNDGRVIYTRWDYVDRHAVHYQHLWSARPDGSDVRAYYGNNTLNPVGVWEARPIPGSNRVIATAAAHHAMTAGSIILLDVTKGVDGLEPITRLTPDVLFPESEFAVQHWHATAGVPVPPEVPIEEQRWPGHGSPHLPALGGFLPRRLQFRSAHRRTARQPREHVRPLPCRSFRQQGVALPRPEHLQPLGDALAAPAAAAAAAVAVRRGTAGRRNVFSPQRP